LLVNETRHAEGDAQNLAAVGGSLMQKSQRLVENLMLAHGRACADGLVPLDLGGKVAADNVDKVHADFGAEYAAGLGVQLKQHRRATDAGVVVPDLVDKVVGDELLDEAGYGRLIQPCDLGQIGARNRGVLAELIHNQREVDLSH